jgi:chromosome segregation ATPase
VLTEKGENNEEARELRRELGKRLNAQPRGRERAEQALDETREHTERLKMLLREAGELAELLQKRLSPREEALNDETTELAAERTELTQRRQQLDRRLDELADRIRRSEGEQRERHLRQFRELANELVAVEKALCQHRLKALEHEADRLRRQIEHIERKNKEVIEDIIRRRLPSD